MRDDRVSTLGLLEIKSKRLERFPVGFKSIYLLID